MVRIDEYFAELRRVLDRLDKVQITKSITRLHEARKNGRQVFIMGNGGSSSTATHFVCDLAKNTRTPTQRHFRVIGLSDNVAVLSAYANDEGYDNIFACQLANLVEPGDVVVAISTSGRSRNVLNAIALANSAKATTIGFTGCDAGELGPMVDIHLHVPSDCIEQVEDVHLMLEHVITKTLREMATEPVGP